MDTKDVEFLQNMFENEVIEQIQNIYNKFQNYPIIKKVLNNKMHIEIEVAKFNNEKIPEYMKYYIKSLVDIISKMLKNDLYLENYCNNINLQIVVSYLFKIIKSKFVFFPSHRLVFIIYDYLCTSILDTDDIKDYIDKFLKELNNDLCDLFESTIKDEENISKYQVKKEKPFKNNIKIVELFIMEYKINKPYLNFLINFKQEFNEIDKIYYYFAIHYLKQIDEIKNINELKCLYSLLDPLNSHDRPKKKITEKIINNILTQIDAKLTYSNIKKIFKYSLKMLTKNNLNDIEKFAKEITEEYAKPKIFNDFDDNDKYYKELLYELVYKIKNITKIPKILNNEKRKYWCCIIKLLDILLDNSNINDSNIKVIIYFIATLYDDDLSFKIEKELIENIINYLFCDVFIKKIDILLYPEIAFLINDNKDFFDIFFNSENEEYLYNKIENDIISRMTPKFTNNYEINIIKNYKFKNKFISIFEDFLLLNIFDTYKPLNEYSNFYADYKVSKINNKFLNIIYILYFYFNRIMKDNEYESLDLNINKFGSAERNNIKYYIKEAISDEKFLNLLKQIIKSNVMKEAYLEIHKKDKQENKVNDDYNLYEDYEKFCDEIEKVLKKDLFIFMDLSKNYKGFTFRFLKIIINTSNIYLDDEKQKISNSTLIKAYLVFLIVHEINHLIKRYYKTEKDSSQVFTPRENEGGEELISLLFGNVLLNRNINLIQANYILDISNWSNELNSFKSGYKSINSDKTISIHYAFADSLCYNGFIKKNN